MIMLILLFLAFLVGSFLLFRFFITYGGGDLADLMMGTTFSVGLVLFLSLVGVPLIHITGGLYEGYSEGERQGYLVKFSRKGFFFKTNEGQLQLGAGQMAAMQAPFSFSAPDEDIAQKLRDNIGKKLKLTYTQWFISPAWEGSSTSMITKVEVLE